MQHEGDISCFHYSMPMVSSKSHPLLQAVNLSLVARLKTFTWFFKIKEPTAENANANYKLFMRHKETQKARKEEA